MADFTPMRMPGEYGRGFRARQYAAEVIMRAVGRFTGRKVVISAEVREVEPAEGWRRYEVASTKFSLSQRAPSGLPNC